MKHTTDQLVGGCDALQGDMAKHQRMFKGEVTPEANKRMAIAAFAELERREQDDPNPYPKPVARAPAAPVEASATTATIDDRTYRVVKEPDSPLFRKANAQEQWFIERAWPRIELLLTKLEAGSYGDGMVGGVPVSRYSWCERVLIACRWQQLDKRVFLAELVQVLEDSSKHFGDWKADAPRRVSVSG